MVIVGMREVFKRVDLLRATAPVFGTLRVPNTGCSIPSKRRHTECAGYYLSHAGLPIESLATDGVVI